MWLFSIPYIGPFLGFAWSCLKIIGNLCNAIPGAIWACVLLVALLWGWDTAGDLADALAGKAEVQAQLDGLRSAILVQKKEAAAKLAAEIGKVLKLEHELGAARAAQETRDAENKKTVAGLRADLRKRSRAAGGPGLRDPWAAGCGSGGGGATPAAAAGADLGAGDAAGEAGRLSSELEGLLLERFERAEAINVAYISCRADSLKLRETYNLTN